MFFDEIAADLIDASQCRAAHLSNTGEFGQVSGSEHICVVPLVKAAGEAMPPSKHLTGLISSRRLVCAPGG
jgi:hypothetical protein